MRRRLLTAGAFFVSIGLLPLLARGEEPWCRGSCQDCAAARSAESVQSAVASATIIGYGTVLSSETIHSVPKAYAKAVNLATAALFWLSAAATGDGPLREKLPEDGGCLLRKTKIEFSSMLRGDADTYEVYIPLDDICGLEPVPGETYLLFLQYGPVVHQIYGYSTSGCKPNAPLLDAAEVEAVLEMSNPS